MSDASPDKKPANETYQVLARKYRPSTFEDMIGQDAMVTTLKNAFETGRIAHAFMLTGVRGIGKTTTARLLARALNYETDTVDHPSVDLATPGRHCEAIMASTHMDVLEMDAASRTGVDNMRELLDGVRYAPADARYKVYIIDEVHMLSAGAFNALLKTLEEPPDHAKFIFATTEIRKVPITVLSRCQRFDLRRVEADVLAAHLKGIAEKEGIAVSDDGLALIARAAEGSVRDGLSLLDQAIVQSGLSGDEVSAEQVRTMLGLADRVRIVDLFEHAMSGDGKAALARMRAQYDDGEVRQAPVPLAAAEMALLKLALAGQMPPPELAAQIIKQAQAMQADGKEGLPSVTPDAPKAHLAPTATPAPAPAASSPAQTAAMTAPKPVAPAAPTLRLDTFEDYVEHVDDLRLRSDLERYVHNALVGRMVRSLQELTGQQWLVSPVETRGAIPLAEQRRNAKAEQDAKDRSHPAFEHPLLKNAELLEIKDRAPNVIAADFNSGDDR